jgi:HAD superfamily hydrolase (TIGR01549 family)
MAYRGVLFDLFGTLIAFDASKLPQLEIDGREVRTTLVQLAPLLERWVPGVGVGEFWRAVVTVSEEMARERADTLCELPSRERFRRTLERVGCDEERQAEAAAVLSRAHMAAINAVTTMPPAHASLLAALRPRYRLGVVSNFDDTATAYEILVRHGILGAVETVVISEAVGLRKPHPALVRVALDALGLAPRDVLFVGDTFADDVGAAHAAGADVAWIDAHQRGVPDGGTTPRYVIRTLDELRAILVDA